jgi:hypothetical protein
VSVAVRTPAAGLRMGSSAKTVINGNGGSYVSQAVGLDVDWVNEAPQTQARVDLARRKELG